MPKIIDSLAKKCRDDYRVASLVLLCSVYCLVLLLMSVFRGVQGDYLIAALNIALVAMILCVVFVVLKTLRTHFASFFILLVGAIMLTFVLQNRPDYSIIWSITFMVGSFGLLNSKIAVIYSAAFASLIILSKSMWLQPELLLAFCMSSLSCISVSWIISKQSEKQRKALESRVKIDSLTKLLNRSTFDQSLESMCELKRRYGYEFGLLMIDIDYFKSINDEFGHVSGDQILIEFSALLTTFFRKEDKIFRVGGEEFVVAMHGTSTDSLLQVAHRLCKYTENNLVRNPSCTEPLTISIGGTTLLVEESCASWLKRADEALYLAKSSRNTAIVK